MSIIKKLIINKIECDQEKLLTSNYISTIIDDGVNVDETLTINIEEVNELDIKYFIEYLGLTGGIITNKVGMMNYTRKYICEPSFSLDKLLLLIDYFMLEDEVINFISYIIGFIISINDNIPANKADLYKVISKLCYRCSESYPIKNNSFLLDKYNKSMRLIKNWKEIDVNTLNILLNEGYDIYNISQRMDPNILIKYSLVRNINIKDRLCSLNSVVNKLLELKDIKFIIAGGCLVSCLVSELNVGEAKWPPHKSTDIDVFTLSNLDYNNLLYWFRDNTNCKMLTRDNVTSIFILNEPICIQVIDTEYCQGIDTDRDNDIQNNITDKIQNNITNNIQVNNIQDNNQNNITNDINDKIEKASIILSEFDLDTCKICYIDNELYVTPGFIAIQHNNWIYECDNAIRADRIERYKHKGITIKTDHSISSPDRGLNKYYMYEGIESDELILKIVKLIFHKNYELTKLPLKKYEKEWSSGYGGAEYEHISDSEEEAIDIYNESDIRNRLSGIDKMISNIITEEIEFSNIPSLKYIANNMDELIKDKLESFAGEYLYPSKVCYKQRDILISICKESCKMKEKEIIVAIEKHIDNVLLLSYIFTK